MTASAQGLLSPRFVAEALTQEIHQLLSLEYGRRILEALSVAPAGRTARWIDLRVIGESGSSKSAFVTLNRLKEAGWAESVGPKGSRIWSITDRGRKALAYARAGDSIGNGGVGVP